MKRSLGSKLLYSILALAIITITGFIAYVIATFTGGMLFYAPLILAAAAGLAVFTVITIFELFSRRLRLILLAAFAGICLLSAAGHEIRQAYINSLTEVSEPEVNLLQYAPFEVNTKAAALDHKPAYQITEQMPRLDGATALYPLYSAFVQAVYPPDTYNYNIHETGNDLALCTTTSEAYKRLIKGDADIIFAAAPSLAQTKQAKLAGQELKLTPVGREAFVFFVNQHNPVNGLTAEQVKDIYGGTLTSWKQVGGKHTSIRAFQRDEGSGSQTMLQKIMGDRKLMNPPKENVADVMSGIISLTASYRNYNNALGFSFLFYASQMNSSDEIKLLEIDGVAPSKESIRSGDYPFTSEFYAVTAGSTNPNIAAFLEWIQSAEGQELVEKTGYTPVK
ncbi:substrate-binding domain-containing protein [Paenibacillus sp. MMS20-IR301]|uniref:PstS family phosphate ABC transporter substrate-binding protein n=1 Tax=Paenibacillus sp. MMS20-IR301 TaxID=2895946 RepID=UPI0028ED6105|nr:substrate-binding domain-containing protein [Paenibacillus sp. MMS20-IR301]WNS44426.1 substrate-binding domain-containing protein [Paenibacillus sp. MMS20-IR301]